MGALLPLFACDFLGAALRPAPRPGALPAARPPARVNVAVPRAAELSPTDREYLAKVRARLLRGKDGARGAGQQKAVPSSSPQSGFSPPEMRGPGADEFADGMGAFNRGQYAASVPHFRAAVAAAGAQGARGGRLSLWLAQALDAAGLRAEAVDTLEMLCAHADEEIARTASELLFIVTAPRLELGADAFVEVPEIDDGFHADGKRRLVAAGLDRRMKMRRKVPEKYSLEWYLKNERPPTRVQKEEDNSWMVLAGIAAGSAAFLLGALPWHARM